MTRSEAKAKGLKRYFTGSPCKHGHIVARFTLDGKCMACNRARRQIWHAANKEQSNAQSRAWRRSNPDKERAYHDRNKERIRLANIARKKATAGKAREQRRVWMRANPQKVAEHNRNRKALRRGAEGKHTAEDIARIRKAQKDRCALCHSKLNGAGHVDHITPVSKGGSNWPNNLQMLCTTCNCRKRDDDPLEFASRIGMLL